MNKWTLSIRTILVSILLPVQYVLAFFVYKLPGYEPLQWLGWGIWVISLIFAVAPIFILKGRGGVAKGKSYVETTRLVDGSLYAIVRHPQYLGGFLFSLSLMLMAQHWVVAVIGVVAMFLVYLDIQEADEEAIQKFGEEYRGYMQRVPQMNFLLGIYRLLKNRTGS